MRKKKNGFTLVELLVTIALMLTILGIAIVSFISVSNNKKKEAWNQVKSQIETAALEYFNANEYLFEGLSNEVTGEISVGKLVQEDYLNQVTNPVTGLLVPNCAVVSVKKDNGRFSASFNEDSIDNTPATCDSSAEIVVSEVGAPKIEEIVITNLDNKGKSEGWYQDGAKFTLNYNTAGNGAITEILRCNTTSSEYCNPDSNVNVETNPSYSYDLSTAGVNPSATVCYSVKNASNKTAMQCATANIDNTDPTCEVSAGNTKWTNRSVTVTGKCSDSGSGCKSNEITKTESKQSENANGTKVSPGTVTHKLGNLTQCRNATLYIHKTAPTIDLHYDNYSANCTSFKNLDGNHVQYKNTVGITDNLSGIASTDYDYKYDGDWLNEEFGRDTKNRARANTAVLQRNGTALKYIYQSYNFLKNKDSTFKIKACDNAGNCTGYQQKKYSAKSSSNFESYCRSKFPTTNSTLRSNYTEKCSSNTSINCWLTADQ